MKNNKITDEESGSNFLAKKNLKNISVYFNKRLKYLLLIYLIIILLLFTAVFPLCSQKLQAKDYQPEITGSFESGDKIYTDPGDFAEEEIVDYYRYDKEWLKYKQKLDVGEYYYLKFQRQERIYDHSETYDNLSLETEGNYTFYLREDLRNRFKFMFRDKDYLSAAYKSYQVQRIQYTLQYEYSDFHDYELSLQKQWTDYEQSPEKDYTSDRISINWGWQVNEDLSLDTKFQIERQINDLQSESTDKYGRKIALKFKYDL